jgi:hypothetical protein
VKEPLVKEMMVVQERQLLIMELVVAAEKVLSEPMEILPMLVMVVLEQIQI